MDDCKLRYVSAVESKWLRANRAWPSVEDAQTRSPFPTDPCLHSLRMTGRRALHAATHDKSHTGSVSHPALIKPCTAKRGEWRLTPSPPSPPATVGLATPSCQPVKTRPPRRGRLLSPDVDTTSLPRPPNKTLMERDNGDARIKALQPTPRYC